MSSIPKTGMPQQISPVPDPNSRIQLDVIAPEKLLSTPEDARAMLGKAAEAV